MSNTNYSQFISESINPQTGYSHLLDNGHYSYKMERIPVPTPKNRVLKEVQKEMLTLSAYGVTSANNKKILQVWRKELQDITKDAFDTYCAKCCDYYSRHLKDLNLIIGDYVPVAQQLIEFYIENKDKSSITNWDLDKPINISTVIPDIKLLIQRLLQITEVEIPEHYEIKKLNEEEKSIKDKINSCEDIELLNNYYAKLIDVLNRKQNYRKILPQSEQYKAIRVLKESGFIESAYMWLDCFPNK